MSTRNLQVARYKLTYILQLQEVSTVSPKMYAKSAQKRHLDYRCVLQAEKPLSWVICKNAYIVTCVNDMLYISHLLHSCIIYIVYEYLIALLVLHDSEMREKNVYSENLEHSNARNGSRKGSLKEDLRLSNLATNGQGLGWRSTISCTCQRCSTAQTSGAIRSDSARKTNCIRFNGTPFFR